MLNIKYTVMYGIFLKLLSEYMYVRKNYILIFVTRNAIFCCLSLFKKCNILLLESVQEMQCSVVRVCSRNAMFCC